MKATGGFMSEDNVKLILSEVGKLRVEIHESSKAIHASLSKIFERVDVQNAKIISAQKDIEYMQNNFKDEIDKLWKEIEEHKKQEKIDIDTAIKKNLFKLLFKVIVPIVSVLISIFLILLKYKLGVL
jgi:hypothetical protein